MGDLRAVRRPTAVLAGTADELFFASQFEPLFRFAGQNWDVVLLPGIAHISMILDPRATAATVNRVKGLQRPGAG